MSNTQTIIVENIILKLSILLNNIFMYWQEEKHYFKMKPLKTVNRSNFFSDMNWRYTAKFVFTYTRGSKVRLPEVR